MKRRFLSILLVAAIVASMCIPAFAATERANRVSPAMYFSDGRVYCSVTITAAYQDIDAELQLWRGDNLVASWPGSGTSYVAISGDHAVTSGRTYTVKVAGTMGGSSIISNPVSATCP